MHAAKTDEVNITRVFHNIDEVARPSVFIGNKVARYFIEIYLSQLPLPIPISLSPLPAPRQPADTDKVSVMVMMCGATGGAGAVIVATTVNDAVVVVGTTAAIFREVLVR